MGWFSDWLSKQHSWWPKCTGTKDKRWLVTKQIGRRQHRVECQHPFHGPRTVQPGQPCFDDQGTQVIMPDRCGC
jgi:hypothetical protein